MSEDQDAKFFGKCDKCQKEKMVFNTIDPYEEELHAHILPVTLCRTCYDLICDEIQ